MSRSMRRALRQSFVWTAILLMVFQPTLAGHCRRRPVRNLLAKIKSIAHNRPTCYSASYCAPTCGSTSYGYSYASPTYSSGCYSTAPTTSYYESSPAYDYSNDTVVSEGYVEGYVESPSYDSYDTGYVSSAGYESYSYVEPVIESSCSSCSGYSYESAPVDEGYASSYVSDSSDCGCGVSVVAEDSGYIDDGVVAEDGGYSESVVVENYSDTGTIVEEGGYGDSVIMDSGTIVDDSSYGNGVVVEDGGTIIEDGSYSDSVIIEDSSPVIVDDVMGGSGTRSEIPAPQPAEVQAPADAAPVEATPTEDTMDDDLGGDFMEDSSGDDAADMFPADDAAGADDMFGEEPSAPAEEATDDLFPEEPATDDAVDENLDDLFGQAADAPPAVPIAPRTWTDNTGNYKTVGQLEKIGPDFIRILKENGRFSTVPMHRLSQADVEYVQMVAKRDNDAELKFAAK